LRQATAGVLGGTAAAASMILESAGVAPTARGEDLSIDDYVRIAEAAGRVREG
ncbi:MAG TPA: 16S rRNA (adenine(1518)-N(6)/adenine(1519)-N(6))-dimethyltransferase, partial [Microbacterium sp.]|nr:16S rRNA (adenine(1518)-N(6)/adenine(1519)-N(6))-dimethyltransferase [Microbacterium sp.]